MPTFDITSTVTMQEVRNAIDQASREVGRKFGRWQDVVVMQKILSAESSD